MCHTYVLVSPLRFPIRSLCTKRVVRRLFLSSHCVTLHPSIPPFVHFPITGRIMVNPQIFIALTVSHVDALPPLCSAPQEETSGYWNCRRPELDSAFGCCRKKPPFLRHLICLVPLVPIPLASYPRGGHAGFQFDHHQGSTDASHVCLI